MARITNSQSSPAKYRSFATDQPIEPNRATLETIAKIRRDNEALAAETKRIGRKMTIAEMKAFLEKTES